MDWLQSFNADIERQHEKRRSDSTPASATTASSSSSSSSALLSEDALESLIDLFEKDAGTITLRGDALSSEDKIDVSRFYTLAKAITSAATTLHARGRGVEAAYHYWIEKRKRLGKALIRIFQEPPPKGNTDPHVAFRPRLEGRRVSRRNPRKDDISAYQKMLMLKRDFARVLEMVDVLALREKAKRERLLLDVQIFDERLALSQTGQRLAPHAAALAAISVTNPLQSLSSSAPPTVSLLSIMRSSLPPSTWIRPEKKKASKKSSSASASSSSSKSSLPPHPSSLSSASALSSKSSSRNKLKSSSSKKDSLPPLSSASSSLSLLSSTSSSSSSSSHHHHHHHAQPYSPSYSSSSDDDFLSEDEDDRAYFHSIDHYIKRSRLSTPADSVEPAFPDEEMLPPLELITPPPGVSSVLGRCRGRVGRAGQLWIDPVLYLSVLRAGGSMAAAMAAGRGGDGMKLEPFSLTFSPPLSLHTEKDHSSATSFSPYPSSSAAPSPLNAANGAAGGGGGAVGGQAATPAAGGEGGVEYHPTPVNIQQLKEGAASVVVDFPVPTAIVQQPTVATQ